MTNIENVDILNSRFVKSDRKLTKSKLKRFALLLYVRSHNIKFPTDVNEKFWDDFTKYIEGNLK